VKNIKHNARLVDAPMYLTLKIGLVLYVTYVKHSYITRKKRMDEKIFCVTTRQARQNMGMFFIYCISYCLMFFFLTNIATVR